MGGFITNSMMIKEFIKKNKIVITLILILAVAIFFRYWQIKTLPGGLFPDEAANGLDVNDIFKGKITSFFERGNGREGLFFYVLSISVAIFGRGPWQHHIVSALIGVLEVLVTFLLVRRLFNFRTAYLAAFFMAVSSWHVVLSRTAFRAILIPLFVTLTFYFLVRFYQAKTDKERIWSAIFAGASFSLGFYSYIAYRMMIPTLGFLLCCYLFKYYRRNSVIKEILVRYGKPFMYFVIATLVVISPLAYYSMTHEGSLIGRSGQVSVFSPVLNHGDLVGTILSVAEKTMLSFFVQGDLNWRHNVSGEPFLPWFLSPLFLLGIFYSIYRAAIYFFDKKAGGLKYMILVVWFFAMAIPELTTAEGIPHGLRLIGVIPALFIFPAFIIDKVIHWAVDVKSILRPSVVSFVVFGFLAVSFLNGYTLYFISYANSPGAYYAYRSDLTVVGDYLNQRNDKAHTYLSLDAFSVQTVDYFTTLTANPYMLIRPEDSYTVSLNPGDQIIFTQSTLFDIIKFRQTHPSVKLAKVERNKFGQTIMVVYEQ